MSYKSDCRIRLPEQDQIAVPVPRIIPDLLFDAVQQQLLENGHAEKHSHWLSGRVMCGVCGSRFIMSQQRLICGGRRRGNGCDCRSVMLSGLLAQISDVLIREGIATDAELLPLLVARVLISGSQITVFVRCRKPVIPGNAYV